MKKIYFSFLMLAMLMVGTVAKAQYTVTVTSDPENNYYSGDQSFDPAAVAEALGLEDAAAVQALIGAGGNVYIKLADETKSNSYTGNTNEFWMNADGVPQGYGDNGTCWYVGLSYDAGQTDEETGETSPDVVDVYMGQMPNFFKEIYTDSELKCTLYLVNGDKEVSFDVTLNVNAAKVPATIADPVALYSQLDIVKEYTGTLEFTEGKQYEGKTLTVDMSDLAEALGASEEAIADNLGKIVLTRRIEQDGESYFIGDSIFTPGSLAADAWFGRYSVYDEGTGTETPILQNAPLPWSSKCTFYANSYKLEEGEFSLMYGQYPGTLKAGDEDFAEFYIVNGDKAAKLTVTVNVTPQETIDPNQLVKVGETDLTVEQPATGDYSTKPFTIDLAPIVEALGCEVSDLETHYVWKAEGEMIEYAETNDGYTGEDGYTSTWAAKAPYFIQPVSLPDGEFKIGQYGSLDMYKDLKEDITFNTWLIFRYQTNYYVVNLTYIVKAPAEKPDDFEYKLVSTEAISMQIIPNNEGVWAWENKTTLDLDYIEGKIGTTDFTLYTDKANDEGVLEWSKKSTCDPAPGFWYGTTTYENEEHQVVVDNAGWGTNSFGVTYASGELTWYQYPGQRSAGDQYEANLYFVNEETGDYIKYILYVSYVEEVKPEGEIVGTEDTFAEMSEDIQTADGYYNAYIDMSKAFEALGIEDPSLIESCSIIAAKSATMFQVVSTEENIIYGYDGYVAADENEVNALVVTVMIDDNGNPYLQIDDQNGLFEDAEAQAYVRIGLEYDGKRYIHNIWLIGSEIATGINATPAKVAAPAAIYSIAGAKLNAMQKGLNIVRMQDGSVKKLFVK